MNTIQRTAIFAEWMGAMKDRKARARIQMRIDRCEDGHFGDCKPVGGGVSEMRIDYGPGYRVYFTRVGTEIYVLLAGGDKSSQSADIKTAIGLARELGR